MQNSSTFSYEPLERTQKEFRLLTIFAGREDEALHSRLTHAILSDPAVVYETISYCWGDTSARDSITVNGDTVDVPASTAAALKCMRKAEEPRIVWIDSVCINQTDLDERADQVGMMADIFRSAKGNLVYLGESDERTRDAFEMVERLYQEIRRKTSDFSQFHNEIRKHLFTGQYAHDKLECHLDKGALACIFERPWFQRLWIVQEAALAITNTCFCGRDFSISLNVLLRVAIWLCYHWPPLSSRFYDFDALDNVAGLWAAVDDKDSAAAAEYSYKQTMTSLLFTANHRQCSEPRDKIFAILSMVDQESENSPEISLLEIEYRKPCHEVLRDATRYAIQEMVGLRILQEAEHRATDQDLKLDGCPSWVARIDRPFDEALDAVSLRYNMFHADADLGTYVDEIRSDFVAHDVLCVSGFPVSHVIEVSNVFEPGVWENRARVADILGGLKAMVGKLNDKERKLWSLPDVDIPFDMALAMMLGVNRGFQNSSVSDVLEFAALLEKLISCPFEPLKGDENELYGNLRLNCSHRRFFTGSDGYIGMAPGCVRAADDIVVLLGSAVPLALRSLKTNDERLEGRGFQLLGGVWINGRIMEGDYVKTATELDLPSEQFYLV
ncbi:heterokaryon incompatibility protein-domain-containing protein [Xylaria flabelliformis]|nr:heterokaryon incompatibility protein-domain-containing protein [Xylaria flabelliformis]